MGGMCWVLGGCGRGALDEGSRDGEREGAGDRAGCCADGGVGRGADGWRKGSNTGVGWLGCAGEKRFGLRRIETVLGCWVWGAAGTWGGASRCGMVAWSQLAWPGVPRTGGTATHWLGTVMILIAKVPPALALAVKWHGRVCPGFDLGNFDGVDCGEYGGIVGRDACLVPHPMHAGWRQSALHGIAHLSSWGVGSKTKAWASWLHSVLNIHAGH